MGDPVAGVRTMLAPEMAAPEGSETCPCKFPDGFCPTAIPHSNTSHTAARYPYFLSFILNIPFLANDMNSDDNLKSRDLLRISGGSSAQTPRRQHHGLPGSGGSLQNWFNSAQERNRSRCRRPFRCHNHDCISFVQVNERDHWHAIQHLLK